jgi:DNA (cytosine-5)-methyltransferase 1
MGSEFRVLSLFSGAGGLDLGLEETNRFSSAACVDHFDDALATLRKNVGHSLASGGRALERATICDVDLSEQPLEGIRQSGGRIDQVDFVAGGPPCQSFSIMGKRKGLTDPRGNLVLSYLSVIERVRPRGFIFENVPGFASIDKGDTYRRLMDEFRSLGYGLWSGVVCAADFGAATLRERLFIVGVLGAPSELPGPQETHAPVGDLENLLPGLDPRVPWVTSAEVLKNIPANAPNQTLVAHTERVVKRFEKLGPGECDPPRRRNRLDPAKPSYTLFTGGVLGKKQARAHIHPFEPRELSPRECARIHGFPDTWEFYGEHDSVMLQVANSVPVALASAIGNHVANLIDAHGH